MAEVQNHVRKEKDSGTSTIPNLNDDIGQRKEL